jgi:transposase-like protein
VRRTRKWAYVAQEAQRLASVGASPLEIATQLGLNKSTVTRWIKSGRLQRPEGGGTLPSAGVKTPAEWAAAVREEFQLDATDDQLVSMAEEALTIARGTAGVHARLAAMGRFQTLTRQLALVSRHGQLAPAATPEPKAPERPRNPAVTRAGGDPRRLLTAVK